MSIYKSQAGKTVSLKLYDEQMIKVGCKFKDIYIYNSFGNTHLIESGKLNGKALL